MSISNNKNINCVVQLLGQQTAHFIFVLPDLDITGAYNRVDHTVLVERLVEKGLLDGVVPCKSILLPCLLMIWRATLSCLELLLLRPILLLMPLPSRKCIAIHSSERGM